MEYETIQPKTITEAAELCESALRVISEQLEFEQGKRKKAWNGDFVAHLRTEAQNAIEWLRSHDNADVRVAINRDRAAENESAERAADAREG